MEENEPLLVLKPKFNAIRFFGSKYLGTLLAIIFLMYITAKAELTVYFLIAIAVYLAYVVWKCIFTNFQYKRIQYWFYDDKLIILNRTKRGQDLVIYYNETIDILMSQDYMQKFFNEGDLVIKLGEGKVLAKTVTLIGIAKYRETVEKLYSIIYGQD